MTTSFTKTLTALDQKMNRLRDQKARLSRSPSRSQRTRTLIQLGGLLAKSGWLEDFQVTLGEDLQSLSHKEKAEQLLGALLSFKRDLNTEENNTLFQSRGSHAMKQAS